MIIFLFSSLADSMEVDGEGGRVDLTALQQIFSREFTCLYLKMANTARLQCNYAVAKRYLQLTEAAVGEVRESIDTAINNLVSTNKQGFPKQGYMV